jgi:hypothetical protein
VTGASGDRTSVQSYGWFGDEADEAMPRQRVFRVLRDHEFVGYIAVASDDPLEALLAASKAFDPELQ